MQIDLGELLGDLLYEHQAVSIPGFGAFLKSNSAASVDKYLGTAKPAGSHIEFNQNLLTDDGLLMTHLKEKFSLSYQEAQQLISDYVQAIKDSFERKEVVIIPKVGRLYIDFEQKLQFIPNAHNFNLDAFGLPEVNIQPVATEAKLQTPVTAVVESTPKTSPITLWLKKNWGLFSVLVLLLAALSIFFIRYPDYFNQQQEIDPTANIPETRLNVKPPVDAETTTPGTDQIEEPISSDTEASTVAPSTNIGIIAIGVFREKENIDRLSKQIIDAGFEPFLEDLGSKTRVGVQFTYEDENEVQEKLAQVRKKFEPSAFVLKR